MDVILALMLGILCALIFSISMFAIGIIIAWIIWKIFC